jgi:NADH-quinone oxidoreductase subunit J
VLLGAALLVVLIGAGAGPYMGSDAVCPAEAGSGDLCVGLQARNSNGNVAGVGRLLFTTYMWPFEVTSALLVIAALGAMVLGKRHHGDEDVTDRPPQTADEIEDDVETGDEVRGELVGARDDRPLGGEEQP